MLCPADGEVTRHRERNNRYHASKYAVSLTLLGPQSRFGDKLLEL